MAYIQIILKIIFFYFFIAITYRIMGKKEVGQLGIMDLIVSILIAELAALSIGNTNQSLWYSIIPICFLVVFQISMAFISIRNPKMRHLFDGKPSVIINNGKLNFKEMIKERYNLDDLLLQLREKDIKNIEEVEYAVLENNGTLSAFTFPKDKPRSEFPMPIILDGMIQLETLEFLGKDIDWVKKLLDREHVMLGDVFYAFYKEKNTYIIKKSDLARK